MGLKGGELIHPQRPAHPGRRGSRAGAVHQLHARDQRGDLDGGLAGGQRIDDVTGHHHLTLDVLDVNDWRITGDGHRFLEAADAKVGVDRCREAGGQLDPFTLGIAESGQREGDGVEARRQGDDLVLAGTIGGDGSNLLDQRGTCGLDRHAGQHGAGRILDDAGNGGRTLCAGGNRTRQAHSPRGTHNEGLNGMSGGCDLFA